MLYPRHVGQRVVVRRLVPGERGPSGGPAMSDVLGVLDAWTDDALALRRESGETLWIPRRDVVTAKPVPPRASVRQRIPAADLQLVCAAGWVPVVQERLGQWLLRAAGGFTRRANSVLPVGDPGVRLDAALSLVTDFYARQALPVLAQVVLSSDAMEALVARNWLRSPLDEPDTLLQIASVSMARRVRGRRSATDDVRLRERPSDDWIARYRRCTGADDSVAGALLTSGDVVAFAQLGDPAVAIARAVLTGDWLGISAVEVDGSLRGRGLGSALVDALLGWGASRGARSAYARSRTGDVAALALYQRYGFATHHAYRFLRPPS